MRLLLFIPLLLLVSCKKDKAPAPCEGITMSGERARFVGTWRWYSTLVEEWFDVGPSNFYNYTPLNQGFDYYFTISEDGILKEYKNDALIREVILSSVFGENFNPQYEVGIDLYMNCSKNWVDLRQYTNSSTDTLYTSFTPFSFDDVNNHLRSRWNYFVKE